MRAALGDAWGGVYGAAEAGWTIYDVDCGHDVMLDAPERLTEILVAEAG